MESLPTNNSPLTFIGGAAGEASGYLFEPDADLFGRREAIGFGEADFHVRLIDRDVANAIIIAVPV